MQIKYHVSIRNSTLKQIILAVSNEPNLSLFDQPPTPTKNTSTNLFYPLQHILPLSLNRRYLPFQNSVDVLRVIYFPPPTSLGVLFASQHCPLRTISVGKVDRKGIKSLLRFFIGCCYLLFSGGDKLSSILLEFSKLYRRQR